MTHASVPRLRHVPLRQILLAALVAAALALAGAGRAPAAAKPTQATVSGKCAEVDKLDGNGALLSATITCTTTGACACPGKTSLAYTTIAVEPGNGSAGREHGTLVATGVLGTVTLKLAGVRAGIGDSKGSWTLGKVTGYKGIALAPHGTYSTTMKVQAAVLGTKDKLVRIAATFSCWRC